MRRPAGETAKRDDAASGATEVFAPRLSSRPRRSGLLASVGAHALVLALAAALGPMGPSPTPSRGQPIVATLVVGLPQAPRTPDAPDTSIDQSPPALLPEPPHEIPAPAEAAHATPAPANAEPLPPRIEADASETELAAAVPVEAVPPEPPPAAPTPAVESTESLGVEPAAVALASERPPPEQRTAPLSADEQRMLQQRLASWAGKLTAAQPPPTLDWRADGERYTAVLTPVRATDPMGMEQLAVEVSTLRGGERFVTELQLMRIAFSSFAQFVDEWDSSVMIHDDVIDGRFHSNSEIRVARGAVAPEFRGRVTLARDIATDTVGCLNRRAMFPAGLETRVRRIPLPARAATFDPSSVDARRMQHVETSSAITFYGDGSYGWRSLDGGTERRRAIDDGQHYIVGAKGAVLEVRGIVDGAVLVYTPENIVITGDVTYARDPRTAGADDYLGLVAERSIEIAAPAITGSGDLEIHASLYARNRFAVREYRSKHSGTLKIFGSLTAGSLTATEPRFATRIEYDRRLDTLRAPGFPLSDRYELASWDGEWRSAPR